MVGQSALSLSLKVITFLSQRETHWYCPSEPLGRASTLGSIKASLRQGANPPKNGCTSNIFSISARRNGGVLEAGLGSSSAFLFFVGGLEGGVTAWRVRWLGENLKKQELIF